MASNGSPPSGEPDTDRLLQRRKIAAARQEPGYQYESTNTQTGTPNLAASPHDIPLTVAFEAKV